MSMEQRLKSPHVLKNISCVCFLITLKLLHENYFTLSIVCITVNREIFAALKVGEFAFFQLAVDKIPRLLQKFNG
jgi:hypothetical protein